MIAAFTATQAAQKSIAFVTTDDPWFTATQAAQKQHSNHFRWQLMVHRHIGGLEIGVTTRQGKGAVHRHIGGLEIVFSAQLR